MSRSQTQTDSSRTYEELQGAQSGQWSGVERLMFPDCSLVFRKSFETFDGGTFNHTLTGNVGSKAKTLTARMASRRMNGSDQAVFEI
jgi:hypothetical protein